MMNLSVSIGSISLAEATMRTTSQAPGAVLPRIDINRDSVPLVLTAGPETARFNSEYKICYSSALETLIAGQASFPDSRGFSDHSAIEFCHTLKNILSGRELLSEYLGTDGADKLIYDWKDSGNVDPQVLFRNASQLVLSTYYRKNRIDWEQSAPVRNQIVLLLDSQSKDRDRTYCADSAITTQQEDLEAAGFKWADDLPASLLCASVVSRAGKIGLKLEQQSEYWEQEQATKIAELNEFEYILLKALKSGKIRTKSGYLYIDQFGKLRAGEYPGILGSPSDLAFGS